MLLPLPRADCWSALQIEELGLEDQVVGIAKGTPYAPYIYYPDHLVQMPTPGPKTTYIGWLKILKSLATEPIFRNMYLWLLHAVGTYSDSEEFHFVDPRVDPTSKYMTTRLGEPTQSLGAYYARKLGDREPVDNILSAMIHGIWGGDVWKLTERRDPFNRALNRYRIPPGFEDWTMIDRGSVDAARFLRKPGEDDVLGREWAGFSHMWFRDGFQTLPRALAAALEKCDNVTIKTASPVVSVRPNEHKNGIYVEDNKGNKGFYDQVVSTLYAGTLASVTKGRLPSLANFPAVTIQAVNLWYPTQKLNHPRAGAGYLIPQTVSHVHNPEKALGVLFDSDRDLLRFRTAAEGRPPNLGTTFTVLLGGHHWDGIPADQLPTAEQAGELAKAVVARHLGISAKHNAQAIVSTKLCRECIPQHHVDHWPRMERARSELTAKFAGRLSVVGPSYQMPGVFGSITAAYDLTNFLAGLYPERRLWTGHFPVGPTGLSRFVASNVSVFERKDNVPLRFPAHILGRPNPTLTQRVTATLRAKAAEVLRKMYVLRIMRERSQVEEELERETQRRRMERRRQEAEYVQREKEILAALVAKVSALERTVRGVEVELNRQTALVEQTRAAVMGWTEAQVQAQTELIDAQTAWLFPWYEAKSGTLTKRIDEMTAWLFRWYEAKDRAQLTRIDAQTAALLRWCEAKRALQELQKQALKQELKMVREQLKRVRHTDKARRTVLLVADQRRLEEEKRLAREEWKVKKRAWGMSLKDRFKAWTEFDKISG